MKNAAVMWGAHASHVGWGAMAAGWVCEGGGGGALPRVTVNMLLLLQMMCGVMGAALVWVMGAALVRVVVAALVRVMGAA